MPHLRRYLSFLKPLQPVLSKADIVTLREAGVFCKLFPFPIIEVDTRSLIDFAGVPYASVLHPHQRAFAAADGRKSLSNHFSAFQPTSLAELWQLPDFFLERCDVSNFSVRGPFGRLPLKPGGQSGDCAHFGPATESFISSEWQRLSMANESLKVGYRPWSHWDGFLRGTFITDGVRNRFLITAGKHRAAVVSQRMSAVKVRLEWGANYVPVVDARRILDLPQVRASVWPPDVVRKVVEIMLKGRDDEQT